MMFSDTSFGSARSRFAPRSSARSIRSAAGRGSASNLESLEQRALLAADLVYDTVAVANNTLPGGDIVVNSTINNTGDADATNFTVRFLLSQDSTLDGGDTELGTFSNTVTIPANGGTRGFAKTLTIPGGTASGNWFIIAVADSAGVITENSDSNNTATDQFFVGNTPAVISSVAVTPSTFTRVDTIQISADVTDNDGIGDSLTVDFWYDADGDEVFSFSADRLIGAGTRSGDTFTFSGGVPVFLAAGAGKVFAVASDGLDLSALNTDFTLTAATTPTIQTLTKVQSGTPTTGDTLTIRLGGVAPADDSIAITAVNLYRESNGTPGLQATDVGGGADELIGLATGTGSGIFEADATILPAWGGSATFYGQAVDANSRTSNTASDTFTITEILAPTIGGVTSPTGNVRPGQMQSFTATGVTGFNAIVTLYRDADGNSAFDSGIDELLATGNAGTASQELAFTVQNSWGLGSERFFLVSTDGFDRTGDVLTRTINVVRNRAPRLTSLTASDAVISKGNTLTLSATGASDDSSIVRVEFYRETSGNSTLDINTDTLLGSDTTASGGLYTFDLTVLGSFRNGNNRFYAKVVDDSGVRSATRSVDVTVTRNLRPAITSLTSRASANPGDSALLVARGVSDNSRVASVRFFFDSNGNGTYNPTSDLLIGNGNRAGNNFRFRYTLPSNLSIGSHKFFAVAVDNLNVKSPVKAFTMNITA